MISPKIFYETLNLLGVKFFVGVPDSLLLDFCAYLSDNTVKPQHITAANEGSALGIAAGYQLSTGELPLVYLQNSGLGNLINPLLSLADPKIYSIPMLIMVGWRGEPGHDDEPQHQKQGEVMIPMIESMGYEYIALPDDEREIMNACQNAISIATESQKPYFLIVRKNTFSQYSSIQKDFDCDEPSLTRENALELIVSELPKNAIIVSTTGKISRELYEFRKRKRESGDLDFLTVGSMGHASQIAYGIAIGMESRLIVCLDGDGAALMHMGGLATIGASGVKNLMHIVLNNGRHDSVGGQKTVAKDISLTDIARGCQYRMVAGPLYHTGEITNAIGLCLQNSGPSFIEVIVKPGARSDLARPKESPYENKIKLLTAIKKCNFNKI